LIHFLVLSKQQCNKLFKRDLSVAQNSCNWRKLN